MQIGEQLKEAREQKNLTLDDIQETTKIQKRYLVAIEYDDFHALPGRFYARAFIKEYANAVGLDSDLLLASFDEDKISVESEEDSQQYSRLKRSRHTGPGSSASILSFLPTVIVVLLIVSILIVAWTLYQKSLSRPAGDSIEEHETDEFVKREQDEGKAVTDDDNDEDENEENTNTETDTTETEEATGTFTIIQSGQGNSPESTVEYVTNENVLKIKLQTVEGSESYVQVKGEDGATHLERLFTSGMVEEIELEKGSKIYFNIGHAPGLKIYINDDLLEYPISENEKVHQKIWLET